MTTEKEILKALRSSKIQLPPLTLRLLQDEPKPSADAKSTRPDAQIEILWDRRRWKFLVEVKANSSPKAFEEAFNAAQSAAVKAVSGWEGLTTLFPSAVLAPSRLA